MNHLDESSSWEFWKSLPGLQDPFIVTEWNPHLLEDHLNSFPACHILFTAHMHDLLPRLLDRHPDHEERIFVPGEGAKEYVNVILGRVSRICAVSLEHFFPRKMPFKKASSFLIINELHPLGGLVPAASVIQELRRRGHNGNVYEHQIALREMFIPDRKWDIHNFPASAADITFAWRNALGIRSVPTEIDLGDCVVFYCPLHFTPPTSTALWKCAAAGARIVTVSGPFTRGLNGEGILNYSPALFEDFDPFQKPPGSHVNSALAEVIAQEISSWMQ